MGDDLFSAGLSTKTSSKTFSGNNTTTVVRVFICEGKPASYPIQIQTQIQIQKQTKI